MMKDHTVSEMLYKVVTATSNLGQVFIDGFSIGSCIKEATESLAFKLNCLKLETNTCFIGGIQTNIYTDIKHNLITVNCSQAIFCNLTDDQLFTLTNQNHF